MRRRPVRAAVAQCSGRARVAVAAERAESRLPACTVGLYESGDGAARGSHAGATGDADGARPRCDAQPTRRAVTACVSVATRQAANGPPAARTRPRHVQRKPRDAIRESDRPVAAVEAAEPEPTERADVSRKRPPPTAQDAADRQSRAGPNPSTTATRWRCPA
jgi:hypothetical protein